MDAARVRGAAVVNDNLSTRFGAAAAPELVSLLCAQWVALQCAGDERWWLGAAGEPACPTAVEMESVCVCVCVVGCVWGGVHCWAMAVAGRDTDAAADEVTAMGCAAAGSSLW